MSANVETMMYVRETPWHGLGTKVQEAPNSAEALKLAGLDWEVKQNDILLGDYGNVIEGFKANVRSTDGAVLGIVSDRYKVVQNAEAFSFTDNLIGGDVRYETAGSLYGGKKVWMLAKLPTETVVGDEVTPYMCFTNAHDGTGSIQVCMTPIRVVCNNTLNLALNQAKRKWSTKHIGNIEGKMHEAQMCLEYGAQYMESLAIEADKLANKHISNDQIQEILNELFPVKETDSDRVKNNVQKMKDEFMICYYMPDIEKFRNTAWGVVNAMSDMVTHTAPIRNTKNYKENNWGRIMAGYALIDSVVASVSR